MRKTWRNIKKGFEGFWNFLVLAAVIYLILKLLPFLGLFF
jgi:hypothetical protein